MTTVIFTREQPPTAEQLALLEDQHIKSCHLPLIHCQPLPVSQEIQQGFLQADWVLFTSAVAVHFFSPYLKTLSVKIGTVGHQTTQAVLSYGLTVDFESKGQKASDFASEWLQSNATAQRILFPHSSLAKTIISDKLSQAGHHVTAWALYETVFCSSGQEKIPYYLKNHDVIWTFASPSAWESFKDTGHSIPKEHEIAVIGETTKKALERDGYKVTYIPKKPTITHMILTIIEKRKTV